MLENKNALFRNINVKNVVKFFYTDIKSIVDENCNITKPVIEYINEI